jgi:hypothetical protein
MKRQAAILISLLAVVLMGATTPNKTLYRNYHFQLNSRWVNGDSGDVVTFYPAEEDTTGKGINLTWIGGSQYVWRFTFPDSSEAWQAYETAGPDSALMISEEILFSHVAPESSVVTASLRDSTVTGLKIATGTILNAHVADSTLQGGKFIDGTITPEKLTFGASGGGSFNFKDSGLDSVTTQTLLADSIMGVGSPTTWMDGAFTVTAASDWYFQNTPEFNNGGTVTTGTFTVASSSDLVAENDTNLGNGAGDKTVIQGDSVSVQTTNMHLRSRMWLYDDCYADTLLANAYIDTVPWSGATVGRTQAWVKWNPTWYELLNTWTMLADGEEPRVCVGYNGDTLFVRTMLAVALDRPYLMWVFEKQ